MRQSVLRTRAVLTALFLVGSILLLWPGMSLAAAPTLGPDCGTGASIVGSDSAGKVTIGAGGGTCTLTFSAARPNAPACTAVNETNTRPVDATTTTTTVALGVGINIGPGDVVSYLCVSY